MPSLDCPCSTGNPVTQSERGKALRSAIGAVLQEDVMLGDGGEMRHVAVVVEMWMCGCAVAGAAMEWRKTLSAAKSLTRWRESTKQR